MHITRDELDRRIALESGQIDVRDMSWWARHRVDPFVVSEGDYVHYVVAVTQNRPLFFFVDADEFGVQLDPKSSGRRCYFRGLSEAARHLSMSDLTSGLLAETATRMLEALERGDGLTRFRVLRILGAFENDAAAAVPKLIELLLNHRLRGGGSEMAIRTLGRIGATAVQAVPLLTDWARNNVEYSRFACVDTLGSIGTGAARAIPTLLDILHGRVPNPHDGGESNVLAALGKIGSAEAIPDLLDLLRVTNDPYIASAVAEALGDIGAAEAAPELLNLLRVTNEKEIASSVARALGKLGSAEAVPDLLNRLRNSEEPEVASAVAEALGKIASEEAIPDLLKVLRETQDGQLAVQVILAIDHLDARTAETVSALELLVRDISEGKRFQDPSDSIIKHYAENTLARIRGYV